MAGEHGLTLTEQQMQEIVNCLSPLSDEEPGRGIIPIGQFILDNAEGITLPDGKYYHYSKVCTLLKSFARNTPLPGIEWKGNEAFCNNRLIGFIQYNCKQRQQWIGYCIDKTLDWVDGKSEAKQAVEDAFKEFRNKITGRE